jgi:hypothetical protein
MGAKHPQDLVKKTGSGHFDFIVACKYLVRSGTVKTPADALRYIEEHDLNIQDVLNDYVNAMRKPVPSAAELEEIPDELL